jgi:hypothetical protein
LNVDKSPPADVRFGSKSDICDAKSHVRFTPESAHGVTKLVLLIHSSAVLARRIFSVRPLTLGAGSVGLTPTERTESAPAPTARPTIRDSDDVCFYNSEEG